MTCNNLFQSGEWEKAFQYASSNLDIDGVREMFLNKAKEEENFGKYRDAETLYVLVGEVDLAIAMYKSLRQHDHVSFYYNCIVNKAFPYRIE